MQRYWECPSCRALLTRERLEGTAGTCPYCDARVGAPADFADPDAPPVETTIGGRGFTPFVVPADVMGKVRASFRLLFEQLPLLALLVLMIKLPSNAAVELIGARDGAPKDPFATLRLKALVDMFFGPIYAGGVLVVLAERMSGRTVTFRDAARAGVDAWWRVFTSRALAGLVILGSCIGVVLPLQPPALRLVFLIPGIILSIRFCMIDSIAVLEQTPILETRRRSSELVAGRAWRILAGCAVAFAIIALVSGFVGNLADQAGILDDPLLRSFCDCLLDVFAVFFSILLFLFYWEARVEHEHAAAFKPVLEEHTV